MTGELAGRTTGTSAQRRPVPRTDTAEGDLPRGTHHDQGVPAAQPALHIASPRTQAARLVQASGGRLGRGGAYLLHLQRHYGNRYVQQIAAHAHRTPPPNRAPVIQTALVLGTPGDRYEREADRMAQRVVHRITGRSRAGRHPDPAMDSGAPAADRAPDIQRLAGTGSGAVELDVQQAVQSAGASGRSLPPDVRDSMEQQFGHDFSRVRVHTDARADQLNHRLQARACTTGWDIFFRRGLYEPRGEGGRRLLAHELTHVVQQNGTKRRIQRNGGDRQPFAERRKQFKKTIDYEEARERRGAKYLDAVKARRRAEIQRRRRAVSTPTAPVPELNVDETVDETPAVEQHGMDMDIDELITLMEDLRISFTDNSGDHAVYPDMGQQDVIVNHNPVPLETIINTKMWEKIPIAKNTLTDLKTHQATAKTALKTFGTSRTQQAGHALRNAMRKIAKILKKIGSIALPKTDLSKSTHHGKVTKYTEGVHVKAKPLSMRSDTPGYGPVADGRLMKAIRKLAGPESKSYKQMHLLNDNTFGPGQLWNLTPGPAKSNSDMEREVEDALKRAVLDKGLVMTYEAKVNYSHDPVSATDQEIDDNPDRYRFHSISFKATQHFADAITNQYEPGVTIDQDIDDIDGKVINWKYGNLTPLVPKPNILSTHDADELVNIGMRKSDAERIVAYNKTYAPYALTGTKNKQQQLADLIKADDGRPSIQLKNWNANAVLWR